MKKIHISIIGWAMTVFVLSVTNSNAQESLVSAHELSKMYKDKDVVIVSARTATDYKKVHITGAVHLDHNTLYKNEPVRKMLKAPDEIATILGDKGINESKTIVLYDDGSGKYAGRLYWILDYMGAKDIRILNGHINAWKAARKPVTRNPSSIKKTTFTPQVGSYKIASMKQVQNLGSAILVDCRSSDEFSGKAETDLRKGHISGAINLEFKNVLDEKGKIKPTDVLSQLFMDKGITADKEVILYCESGVRAGIMYFTLTSILKYPKVKIYDGAYLEWSASSNKVVL